jgi:hypothetical protein
VDADLFKLLFHELTTGYIIRQHRGTNAQGQFLANRPSRRRITPNGVRPMKSAFADEKSYELTELGDQLHASCWDIDHRSASTFSLALEVMVLHTLSPSLTPVVESPLAGGWKCATPRSWQSNIRIRNCSYCQTNGP